MRPAWINADLTSMAFLWRLERRDGVTLGFTSHDRDLVIGGLKYRSSPGLLPSAIERSDGFDADTVELAGALTSDAITETDLAAGRWDGAALSLSAVDWSAPDVEPLYLVRGELGEVSLSGGGFSAELRGPTSIFDAPVVERTSPSCRAVFGDKKCRVDLAQRRRLVRVVSVAGDQITVDTTLVTGAYDYGSVRWLQGSNGGLESVVLKSTGPVLTLRDPPFFALEIGSMVELIEGCDKRFETCTARFANADNFRGEPHLPGNDLLSRYVL